LFSYVLTISQTLPSVRECTHAYSPSHTNTHIDGPCSYLVYMNNDLGIMKSTNGISFKCLCQNYNVSQYEDGISLIVLSQWQMWKVWMCKSQNSLKSHLLCTSDLSHFHKGASETWEISLHMQAHHLPLPQWPCLSVDLWEAQYFRILLYSSDTGIRFHSLPSQAAMCQHVLNVSPVEPEHCEPETQ